VAISLAGRDLIVDTLTVQKYLACRGDLEDMQEEDMAEVLEIGLAGRGQLPPASQEEPRSSAAGHLMRSGIELVYCPGLDHAQVFDSPKDRGRIVEILRRYCAG